MGSKQVIVQFYGAFRSSGAEMVVNLDGQNTVADLKSSLATRLAGQLSMLVGDSVIATGTRILSDSEEITGDARLSILPPVCGG